MKHVLRSRRRVLGSICGAAGATLLPGLRAQTPQWPARPIRFVVPSAAGGAADFVGRTFGAFLQQRVQQPVVVENKPGAAAIIGAEAAKNSPPDGYTFLVSGSSTQAANVSLFKRLPYDPEKDFVEVGIFGLFPNIAVVKPDGRFRGIDDIIRQAAEKPGTVTYGYYSSSSQVPPALIQAQAGLRMTGASYKNITQIISDVAGGVLDFAFLDALSAAPALNGLLTPIAVTSPEPFLNLPDVPPVARVLPGFEVQSWLGLSAPAGTPGPIVSRINEIMKEASADPSFQEAISKKGMTVRYSTPAEHSAFAAADRKRWAEWVRIARIEPQ